MQKYFAGVNGFGALYLIVDGVLQPLHVAQCQEWLPGVKLAAAGSTGEHVRLLTPLPARPSSGMLLLRITNGPGGPGSNELRGFGSADGAAEAMAKLHEWVAG